MQRLEVSCAVRLIYTSLGTKGLTSTVYGGDGSVSRSGRFARRYAWGSKDDNSRDDVMIYLNLIKINLQGASFNTTPLFNFYL